MTHTTLLPCLAVVASLILLVQHRPVGFAVVAAVASGLEALMAFGFLHMSVARVPLGLVLGAVLVVAGVAIYVKGVPKMVIAAATTVILVGALQVYTALHH
jgi:hypothetical protein